MAETQTTKAKAAPDSPDEDTGTDRAIAQARRRLPPAVSLIASAIAIALAAWHLWLASFGVMSTSVVRYLHLGALMTLVFLHYRISAKSTRDQLPWYDWALVALSTSITLYCVVNNQAIAMRVGSGFFWDLLAGGVLILLVLEMTRRTCGIAMPILAIAAILYAFVGPFMPSFFAHRGYGVERIIDHVFISTDGIYGLPLGISASLVAVFMVFSAFLETTGSGNVFIKLANSLVGSYRGGPAKVAIVASGMFGSFSGSATANVVGTGSITIPMMKRLGYRPVFAGAVEAVASTGGLIMPPIMAAGAFLIAEFLGIGYFEVVVAAVIPAFLYFLSVGLMIHLEALKTGLKGLPRDQLPSARKTLAKGWPLLLPVLLLFFLLGVQHQSPAKAACWATVLLWLIFAVFYERKLNVGLVLTGLRRGAESMMGVVSVCACAGILIGIFSITGLAFRLSTIMVELSGGSLPLLLVLTMITSIVLGMGMPPTASYIILVLLIIPSLVEQGVPPIAAHLFVFYFANISNITPPVAIAAYAAAGIAGGSAWQIGWSAFRLGAAAFIVPYMFIYGPELLMIGSVPAIVLSTASAALGCLGLAVAVQGYLFGHVTFPVRMIALAAAMTLIKPGISSDLIGLGLLFLAALSDYWLSRRRRAAEMADTSTTDTIHHNPTEGEVR